MPPPEGILIHKPLPFFDELYFLLVRISEVIEYSDPRYQEYEKERQVCPECQHDQLFLISRIRGRKDEKVTGGVRIFSSF